MPTATFTLTLHAPLPASLPPPLVVRALHAHEPLIRPNPYLQTFRRVPPSSPPSPTAAAAAADDDPFFSSSSSPDDNNTQQQQTPPQPITTYEIHDRIPLFGPLGLYKDTVFPALFQNTPRGVKVRADAAMGIRVRSRYEVCPASDNDNIVPGREEEGPPQWELVEQSLVECSALLKPFVRKQFEAGHRYLCQKVLENLVHALEEEEEAAANNHNPPGGVVGSSSSFGNRDKDLPPLPTEAETEEKVARRW